MAAAWIAFFGVATGMAVSVLQYRMWHIDLLVRRSVTYTLVTAIPIGIYLGLAVLLRPAVRPVAGVSGVSTALSTALSTLGVEALFHPLRRRPQVLVYRRSTARGSTRTGWSQFSAGS